MIILARQKNILKGVYVTSDLLDESLEQEDTQKDRYLTVNNRYK